MQTQLNSNIEHYHNAYQCYYRMTIASAKERINDEFDSFIVDRLRQNVSSETSLQVLGVGSGNGYREIQQLKKLRDKFAHVDVSVVEPSEKLINEYKDAVKMDADASKGISYQWFNQPLHEVCAGTEKKYHFISSIHSVYFLGKPEDALTNLYNMLEPEGEILILCGGLLSLVKELPLPPKINHQHIKSALDKLGIPYRQHSSDLVDWCDVSCIVAEDHSTDYELLLDFLTATVGFTKTAPHHTQRLVLDYIKRTAVARDNKGKYLADHCIVFVITK